jgi:hypothetical protein
MNFIRHKLHPKIIYIWSIVIGNRQTLRRFGLILLLLLSFTLTMGLILAEEPASATTNQVIFTPRPTIPAAPVSEYSILSSSSSDRIELLAQSQISPTITSYPGPPSPTANPSDNPQEGIEEPYPDLAPDSIEQPLIPYPDSSPVQSPGLNPVLTQTPPFQDPISPPAIGSNTNGNAVTSSNDLAQTSSAVNATILWIAFFASLLLFVSAILWSILYFSRQRGRE